MSFEKKFFLPETSFWLIASDEAGRGPLAGPVVSSSVALRVDCPLLAVKRLAKLRRQGVKDSKLMKAPQRAEVLTKLQWQHDPRPLQRQLLAEGILVSWAMCDAQEIDRINILQASLKSMRESAMAVSPSENTPVVWLIDGNRAPRDGNTDWRTETVVDGDAKSVLIGLASVVAKEIRDRLMQDYHQLYPAYGFNQHVGYGTEAHRRAITEHGITPIHRQTYAPVREYLARTQA